MARILLVETNPAGRRLLAHRLEQLGHEPVVWPEAAADAGDVDAALVEPTHPEALAFARRLRRDDADLPIVISSVSGRTLETAWLRPAAHLVRPYALSRLERALDDALALALPLARAS